MGTGIQQGRTEGRRWAGAIITAVLVWAGLAGVGFTPEWAQPVAALAAAALWLVSADLAAMLVLAVFALPLLAASPVLGVTFLALGIVSLRYLGSRGGAPLLIVLGAFAGVTFGPAWAVAALAGYVLGAGEGALAAALSCLAVQAYGLALGLPALGATVTGGGAPLLRLGESGTNLLSFAWLASAVGEIDAGAVEKAIDIMTKPGHPMALVLQPLAWAAAAAVAGSLAAYLRGGRRKSLAPVAAALGALVPGVALTAIFPVLDVPVRVPVLISSATTSAVVAGLIALAWESLARTEVAPESAAGAGATVVQEDADVDELLTLIATAEDKLSAQHTAHKTVMITDMKAFARMTEEDGSVLSAKAIQRHRDLLMPLIDRHGGHGKSTGGDGLVAAFDEPSSACTAAAAMLRALDEYNGSHVGERPLAIRIGIAQGEVVLDRRGRPFIGNALNIAARVMALADGGQALAVADVAAAAPRTLPVHCHGDYQLKNIADPVSVCELLWSNGQNARTLGERASA